MMSRTVFYGRTSSRLVFIFAPAADILSFLPAVRRTHCSRPRARKSGPGDDGRNLVTLIAINLRPKERVFSFRRLIEMPRYLTSPSIRERYRNLSGRSKVIAVVAVVAYRKAVIAARAKARLTGRDYDTSVRRRSLSLRTVRAADARSQIRVARRDTTRRFVLQQQVSDDRTIIRCKK